MSATTAPLESRHDSASRATLIGFLFAATTLTIWAVWIVTTRLAVSSNLPVLWLGVFRFGVPALALSPFWLRAGLLPRGVDWWLIALMVAGAGAPFFLSAAQGMHYAPAAEVAVLLPGMMPFFVAILAAIVDRERFSASRLLGLAFMLLATVAIGGVGLLSGGSLGQLLIPFAAALWAFYTLAYKRSGLDPLAAAGIIATWSLILILPLALVAGTGPLFAINPWTLASQILIQGVLTGVVALVAYGAAVARLGPSRAAVVTGLAPALAAVIAVPVLNEIPTPLTIAGIVAAFIGVALASGVAKLRRG